MTSYCKTEPKDLHDCLQIYTLELIKKFNQPLAHIRLHPDQPRDPIYGAKAAKISLEALLDLGVSVIESGSAGAHRIVTPV